MATCPLLMCFMVMRSLQGLCTCTVWPGNAWCLCTIKLRTAARQPPPPIRAYTIKSSTITMEPKTHLEPKHREDQCIAQVISCQVTPQQPHPLQLLQRPHPVSLLLLLNARQLLLSLLLLVLLHGSLQQGRHVLKVGYPFKLAKVRRTGTLGAGYRKARCI